MELTIYQVDAFTDQLFGGNPAAVCPLMEWLPTDIMQKIALENNLSETAFIIPEGEGYHIRWFTPAAHTTLTPYWTKKLDKTQMVARQLSERGGLLHCEYLSDRVNISGNAVTYLRGKISI